MPSQQALFGSPATAPAKTISPLLEMGAYEVLWSDPVCQLQTDSGKVFSGRPEEAPGDNRARRMGAVGGWRSAASRLAYAGFPLRPSNCAYAATQSDKVELRNHY